MSGEAYHFVDGKSEGDVTLSVDQYRSEVIDPGDRVSQLAREVNVVSYMNNEAVAVVDSGQDSFRGPVGFVWRPHVLEQMARSFDAQEQPNGEWPMTEAVENDGAGGKPMFFTLAGTEKAFRYLGWEIIAMTADDLARNGRFPAVMANEVCFRSVTEENYPLIEAMFTGFGSALRQARLVSITGETAIMKHQITGMFDQDQPDGLVLTWGGTCIGLRSQRQYFDGSTIEPGMTIVGLWEPGYRCNGGTLMANIIKTKWGTDPEVIKRFPEARSFIEGVTVPSLSYARTMVRLAGWLPNGETRAPLADIRGVAHITGGGLWNKLSDVLPEGIGARLLGMPVPSSILLDAQRLSLGTEFEVSDWRAYSTFHGGCGMLVVVAGKKDVDVVIEKARQDGIVASLVGETCQDARGEIQVTSRFSLSQGEMLSSLSPT